MVAPMPGRVKAKQAPTRRRTSAPAKAVKASSTLRPARPAAKLSAKPVEVRPKSNVVAAKPPVVKPAAKAPVARPAVKPVVPAIAPANGVAKSPRFLASLADYEKLRIVRYNDSNFDLDRMRTLLKKLGNPQDSFRSVHVAGTKGKGSTCTMIAAMLQACGYRVGLYTSPHLVDVRERMVVNGQMISQADFNKLSRTMEPIVSKMKPAPTYFDVLTAMAFKYFADQKVDIAVVETGLGGRLDSTNVLKPDVTAITSISKDHMQQLGGTLARIAEEKAGIFKPGVPAVTVMQDPSVEPVLQRVAQKVGAPLDICGKSIEFSYRFESSRMLGRHNRVCLTTATSKFEHMAVPLFGEHQAINCGLALAVIDKLKSRGVPIDDNKAMEGLSKTTIEGRMEVVNQTPRVLVDGAHNAASIDAMMKAIGQHIPYDSMIVIFACCSDKDVDGMLERITSGADKVIFTRVNNIRSADPNELAARYVEQYGKMAQVADTLEEALSIANRAVSKEDLICITGSFYLIGDAKKHFAAAHPTLPQVTPLG